ncbi:MAG: translation factor Sua5 [Rhodospirillales bacterium]|nr:translation factor Sua5 [Rhodospirillales bacterium]
MSNIVPATPDSIGHAGELIATGRLVAFPTETVYGLGADATQGRAVAAIFAAKGRPSINPLIVHVADMRQAEAHAVFDSRAEELATRFWPGPLTLILKRRANSPVSELATAGLESIAIRIPSHPVARALLSAAGRPIAAPSANRSGRVSATTAIHVAEELGTRVDLILAAGKSPLGLESTILDLSGDHPVVLRPGAVTAADLAEVIEGLGIGDGNPDRPNAPGQLRRHYSPETRLRLNAAMADPGEALLAFGPDPFAGRLAVSKLNLSATGDLNEAAANLFAMLRTLDAGGHHSIAVMPVPEVGLGIAINDRLRRAAAPVGDDATGSGNG